MNKLAIVFLITTLSTACAHAQLIDNFSDGDASLTVFDLMGETVAQTGLSATSTIGGQREVYAGTLGGDSASLEIDTQAQLFRFSADSDNFGYFRLTYGNSAPLNIDFTASGATAIQLDFSLATSNLFRGSYNVILESPNARASQSYSRQLFDLPGAGQIVLPFDEFRADFGDIDFSSISAVEVSGLRVEPNARITLNSVAAVSIPEPSSLAITAAAMSAAFSRRRKSQPIVAG